MANNGLLFISNAAKAHNVCVKASQFVRKVLYVNIKVSPEATLPMISKQIVNVYSKVIWHQHIPIPSTKIQILNAIFFNISCTGTYMIIIVHHYKYM